MPRIRRRSRPRRGYTPNEIKQLQDGVAMGGPFGALHKGRADRVAMGAAWAELRDDLLPAWVAEHPFTRPLGYWLFDATQPRIQVFGEQKWESQEWLKTCRASLRGCYFHSLNERLGFPDTRPETGDYESEKQYATRCGLLFPSERELL